MVSTQNQLIGRKYGRIVSNLKSGRCPPKQTLAESNIQRGKKAGARVPATELLSTPKGPWVLTAGGTEQVL